MTKFVLSLFAAACLLRADFDPQRWQVRRAIQVQETAAMSEFVVDASVYRHSRAQLKDLRILRDSLEVPYQLQTLSPQKEEVELRPTLLNKGVLPHTGVQAVLDLNGHQQHNQLRLVTGQKNFKETVWVETSDDGRNWAMTRRDGLIFDISREHRDVSDLTVEYPLSTRRYLRLTIPGWNDSNYLESAWLTYYKETEAVRDTVATLTPVVKEDPKAQSTSLLLDLGFEGMPCDQLKLSVNSGLFFRDVEIFGSKDQQEWSFAGSGVILRTANRTQLSVQVPEQWSRYLKVVVFNSDNTPLTVDRVTLSGLRRVVRFPSTTAGSYWLYSGNATAREPAYDLARVMPEAASAMSVSLGVQQNNAQYQLPAMPLTDRYPHLLITVLIGAVAVMGYITLRFLLKLKAV